MIWMEFRCENRTNPDRPQAQFGPRCWSDTNTGPMDGTGADTQADVLATYRDLCNDAIKAGWKRRKDGWTCPDCVKALATHQPAISTDIGPFSQAKIPGGDASNGAADRGAPEPCGGCGEADPAKRCLGCLHDFGAQQ